MTLHSRCPVCEGLKKIRKLGNILSECDRCKGIGYIRNEEVLMAAVKRGRKPQGDKDEVRT